MSRELADGMHDSVRDGRGVQSALELAAVDPRQDVADDLVQLGATGHPIIVGHEPRIGGERIRPKHL